MATDNASVGQNPTAAPADPTHDGSSVEIEFEIVSYVRPRSLRMSPEPAPSDATGAAGSAAWHPVVESTDDDTLLDVVLWAYYEACRRGAEGDTELPWESARPDWQAFAAALRADPDRPWWWPDAPERLRRAREAFGRLGATGARRSRSASPPSPLANEAKRGQVYVTPEGYTVTVRPAPGRKIAPPASVGATWRWDSISRRVRGGP